MPRRLLELAFVIVAARRLGVTVPLGATLVFFGGFWVLARAFAHARFMLVSPSSADEGGEVLHVGPIAAAVTVAVLAGAAGVAWAAQPPTVHLASGVHRGPLVLDHSQRLVGEKGAVVLGGIVISASDVTVVGVKVVGGEYGIEVDGARRVVLDRISVTGADLDGVHVRRGSVTIRDCTVDSRGNEIAQGIDISYTFDLPLSVVERCTVVGGNEGIVSHFANVRLRANHVRGTALRGITVTEMSMGVVDGNRVENALGVGIYCGDHSMCRIDHNAVSRIRPDIASGDLTRIGYGILVHYGAQAELGGNRLSESPGGVAAVLDAHIEHHR